MADSKKNSERIISGETGELMPPPGAEAHVFDSTEVALRQVPDFSKAKPIESVVGKRPPLFNLKDHKEFADHAFTIVKVKEAEGTYGYHLYLAGWLSGTDKPGEHAQAMVIRTGSEFVLGRIVPAISVINGGQALTGILRSAGDAWLFE